MIIPFYVSRIRRTIFAGLILVAMIGRPVFAAEDDNESFEAFGRVIDESRDKVFPALVNIEVVAMDYWGGREQKGQGVGSGTIISAEGHVLTNTHVVHNGIKFTCTLTDKQEVPAELIGEDPMTDLAVIKIDKSKLKDPNMTFAVGQFGDSDALKIGDHVMAMGSPFALSRSVTLGIVSNTERVFTGVMGEDDPDEFELMDNQRTGLFNRWIQHDALINPGNSGGPLVNLYGEIVGVNARGGGSMGFAIPGNFAQAIAKTLIEKKEVPRSYFGISIRPIKDTGFEEGVLVNSVEDAGPSHKAGLQAGDLITSVNGEAITVRFHEETPLLLRKLAEFPIGGSVKLAYKRGAESGEVTVTTEKLQKDRGDERAFRGWGLTGMEITDRIMRDWKLTSRDGVLVTGVRQGSPSQTAEPDIQYGDVIVAVNNKPVKTLQELIATYDELMKPKSLPESLLIETDRRGKNTITLIKPKQDEEDDPPREVAKAWIGINVQPVVKNLAEKLGDSKVTGFRISRVYPGTLAAASDLKVGDIITAVNETPIAPKGMQDAGLLDRTVRQLTIGEKASLTVMRGAEQKKLEVDLERTRINSDEARRDKNRDFELSVREITFFDRDDNRWSEDVNGVLVEDVEQAGWAGLGGIRPYDLIVKVGEFEIKDLDAYRNAMKKTAEAQPERVVMVVLRGPRTFYQFIEPDWKPVPDETTEPATP